MTGDVVSLWRGCNGDPLGDVTSGDLHKKQKPAPDLQLSKELKTRNDSYCSELKSSTTRAHG